MERFAIEKLDDARRKGEYEGRKERFPVKYIFIFSIRGLVGTCDRNAVLR